MPAPQVTAHVQDAVAKGGKVLTGGSQPELAEELAGGNFFTPTVISGATIDMRCFREETFGPLVPLFRCAAGLSACWPGACTSWPVVPARCAHLSMCHAHRAT